MRVRNNFLSGVHSKNRPRLNLSETDRQERRRAQYRLAKAKTPEARAVAQAVIDELDRKSRVRRDLSVQRYLAFRRTRTQTKRDTIRRAKLIQRDGTTATDIDEGLDALVQRGRLAAGIELPDAGSEFDDHVATASLGAQQPTWGPRITEDWDALSTWGAQPQRRASSHKLTLEGLDLWRTRHQAERLHDVRDAWKKFLPDWKPLCTGEWAATAGEPTGEWRSIKADADTARLAQRLRNKTKEMKNAKPKGGKRKATVTKAA
jgi:hypothetical protein